MANTWSKSTFSQGFCKLTIYSTVVVPTRVVHPPPVFNEEVSINSSFASYTGNPVTGFVYEKELNRGFLRKSDKSDQLPQLKIFSTAITTHAISSIYKHGRISVVFVIRRPSSTRYNSENTKTDAGSGKIITHTAERQHVQGRM